MWVRSTVAAGCGAVVCLSLWALASVPVPMRAQDVPDWLEDVRRDLRDIRGARKNRPELYRTFVGKWRQRDRLDPAVGELALASDEQPTDAALMYGLGYAYAVRGSEDDLSRAESGFRRAAETDPGMVLAHYSLGGVLHRIGRSEEALAAYSQCIRPDETYVRAYYAMGETYRSLRRWPDALQSYELATLRAKEDWPHPHVGKGLVLVAQGDDDGAEVAFREALTLDDDFAAAYFQLGQIRARAGLEAQALEVYRMGASHGGYPPAELQALGRIFARNGSHAQAEMIFGQAVGLRGSDASLHLDLGDALWAQGGKQPAAVAEYREAMRLDESYADVFARRVEREFFAAEIPVAEAKDLLDKALAVDAGDAEALVLYARVETASGDLEAAIQRYVSAARIAPERTDIHFPMGDLYFVTGSPEQALQAYVAAIELEPHQRNRYAVSGRSAYRAREWQAAASDLKKHLLIAPDEAPIHYLLGRSLESLGETARAIEAYEAVRRLASTTEDALTRLARLYEASGDVENALRVLTELVGIEPNNVSAHFTRGEILRNAGESEEAIAAFERVVVLDDAHVDAHEAVARLYEAVDEDASIEHYQRAIELDPDRPTPRFRLGAILLARDQGDEVIPLYTRALEIEPRRAREQVSLARLLHERGRLEEALPHYAAAVDVKDDEAGWQYDYGRCAHGLLADTEEHADRVRLLDTADAAYTRSIEVAPSADAHLQRGRLRRDNKQVGGRIFLSDEIAADFKGTLELRADDAEARYLLGMTYVGLDNPDLAKEAFSELLRRHPRYANANAELGALAEDRREYREAVRLYERELAINPSSARAHYRLGFLYHNSLGDPGTASEHFERAIELDPHHVDALVEYGRVLYEIDRVRGAADQFERAIKLDPENLTANYNLALMYQYLGKSDLAIQRWRYLLTLKLLPPQWKSEARTYVEQLEQRR